MLFNSYIFILVFLPVCMMGFHLLQKLVYPTLPLGWLVLCSLFFYGWWCPAYLVIIVASMLGNYLLARGIEQATSDASKKRMLAVGVIANLALLGYYKYANFFVDQFVQLSSIDMVLPKIILPLAISFFTFQQIAFLVDVRRSEVSEHSFLEYSLFVTFFPQLIAGPIVHHREMLPQFHRLTGGAERARDLAIGITIFTLGLFKKAVIADGFSPYAASVFDGATGELSFAHAWMGAFGYAFQLYFDFSGYSDMAIGLARMFGIRLPMNFYSPYKAHNILEFWRRWHITLSRFLRDYLYIPLGGNRRGMPRRYINLLLTMLLGGLWHGAGWTFVIWGGLHGLYLVCNHAWHALRRRLSITPNRFGASGRVLSIFLTFLSVVVAWVFFRAPSVDAAFDILGAMFGNNGFSSEVHLKARFVVAALVIWGMPNIYQFMANYHAEHPDERLSNLEIGKAHWLWTPGWVWAVITSSLLVASIFALVRPSEFLYYQF